jgi:hypothetical protein
VPGPAPAKKWTDAVIGPYQALQRLFLNYLGPSPARSSYSAPFLDGLLVCFQVNVTVAIANWEGIGRKASARDNRKGLK